VSSGPDAIAALLRDAGRLWTVPGRALQLSLVRLAAWPAYKWVADHRHLLPGGTAACSLPQAQREKLYGSRTTTE
jgi:predicted DCC family thiol-disulfide oxidoreductase YuxK